MKKINFNNSTFVTSVAQPGGFLDGNTSNIVFAGKSNVGKSSVINKLVNRKNFARVSSVPGKTVHVNYFSIDDKFYFIDLPGYGYAKVSTSEKERWNRLMESFFENPERIDLGVLIVDARHKPTADDIKMNEWFAFTGRPYVIVANKCDKLNKTEFNNNIPMIRDILNLEDSVEIIPFSALNGLGKNQLINLILEYV